jgi:hypothetical protein
MGNASYRRGSGAAPVRLRCGSGAAPARLDEAGREAVKKRN